MFAYCGNNPVNAIDTSGTYSLGLTKCGFTDASLLQDCAGGVVLTVAALDAIEKLAAKIKSWAETKESEKEPKDQSVYILRGKDNLVKYVGRTNNTERRFYEHTHDPNHPERREYSMIVLASNLSLDQAKVWEQVLISAFSLGYLENARREIAVGKITNYAIYLDSVQSIIEGAAEDTLLGLMGR